MNTALRAYLDTVSDPVAFSIITLADLRDADAVLVVNAHW